MTTLLATDAAPRLFVVDDEAALTHALCCALQAQGYEVQGFTSAHAALDELQRGARCDLVLVDLAMPQMRGIELLRAAQALDPTVVGVIMTGEGSVSTAVEAMKAGALDFILKPFNMKAIVPALARALELRRLRVQNAALEQRVRDHAAELELANRELAAANKELSAFTYSVSHDLRAPLRAVDGLSELLVNSFAADLPVEAQRFLTTMNLSVKRMKQLVDDLMRLSSLGQQALHPQQVDMAAMVHSALADVRDAQQEQPQVDLRIGHLPAAVADPALLRQVLVNLLSNAFKFTRHREHPMVEVGVLEQPQGPPAYFVRDNGAGFDMARAQGLFGVFQRLHRDDEFEGSGVGLSIAQRIVERHHGRIWADAAPGRGATFYFTLGAPA